MKVRFLAPAKAEFFDAMAWYKAIDFELAQGFHSEVVVAARKVKAHPEAWRRIASTGHRRINLDRFPYFLAYRVREDELHLTAVIHQHSDPKRWQELLKSR